MYDKFFKDMIALFCRYNVYYPEPKPGEFKDLTLSFLERYFPLSEGKKWEDLIRINHNIIHYPMRDGQRGILAINQERMFDFTAFISNISSVKDLNWVNFNGEVYSRVNEDDILDITESMLRANIKYDPEEEALEIREIISKILKENEKKEYARRIASKLKDKNITMLYSSLQDSVREAVPLALLAKEFGYNFSLEYKKDSVLKNLKNSYREQLIRDKNTSLTF